jgi:uncharacterized FlaG/YvyC family protein
VPTAVSAPVAAELKLENRDIIAAVNTVNRTELLGENELAFQLDRESRRPVILIVDRKTKEVVQQIPPEYVLRVAADLKQNP